MATGFVYAPPFHGHINPLIPVISELVRRGEHIVFFADIEFQSIIEASGAEFRPYPEEQKIMAPEDFQIKEEYVWLLSFMLKLLQAAERLLPDLLVAVQQEQPDYIIYDSLAPWGKMVAQIIGLPHISSCTIYYIGMENYLTITPKKELGAAILRNFSSLLRKRIGYLHTRSRIQNRWDINVPYLVGFFGNKGEKTILYTSRLFQEGADKLDRSFIFVGHPMLVTPTATDSVPASKIEHPHIYISLGTLFNNQPNFFKTCLVAFQNSPYHIVITTGGCSLPDEILDTTPPNAKIFKWLPPSEIHTLMKKTVLFITHCGANSTKEAFLYGKPMLLAPQMADQFSIANRTEQLGAGKTFDWETTTPRQLLSLAEQVINDASYRENSLRIGNSLREAGSAEKAADEILTLLPRTYAPSFSVPIAE